MPDSTILNTWTYTIVCLSGKKSKKLSIKQVYFISKINHTQINLTQLVDRLNSMQGCQVRIISIVPSPLIANHTY